MDLQKRAVRFGLACLGLLHEPRYSARSGFLVEYALAHRACQNALGLFYFI